MTRAFALLAAVSLQCIGGCDSRRAAIVSGTGAEEDGRAPRRDGSSPDQRPDARQLQPSRKIGFVIDRLRVSEGPGKDIGLDLDGDGSIDNALGEVLVALDSVRGSAAGQMQQVVDLEVCTGRLLLLLKLQVPAVEDEGAISAKQWRAFAVPCCDSPEDVYRCCEQARQQCFDGSQLLAAEQPASLLDGSLASNRFELAGDRLLLPVPGVGLSKLLLHLRHVRIVGTLSGSGIEAGIIAGVLTADELRNTVIPALAIAIQQAYESGDPEVRAQIGQLFDTNFDGKISVDEVANHSLISTFLAGDVDVDGDGEHELSFGVGFSAVPAMIE